MRAPTGLIGVAASATGCAIAVWGPRDVYVSRDDGASFVRLAEPVAARSVVPWAPGIAVAVGADETVYVVRSGGLELELRDGTLRSRALPDPSFDRIHVTGSWIILRSHDELAASNDAGLTWQRQPIPAEMTAAAIRIDDEGVLHLAAATSETAPVTYYVGHVHGGLWRAVWTSRPHRYQVDPNNPGRGDPYRTSIDAFAFGSDGHLYAQSYDSHGYQLFAVSSSGSTATPARVARPSVLRGVPIVGPRWPPVARDAHGFVLSLVEGRGPVRTSESLDQLMTNAWSDDGRGRWLVGGVVDDGTEAAPARN